MQIFNIDETGMPLDAKCQRGIYKVGEQNPAAITSGDKTQITVVGCVQTSCTISRLRQRLAQSQDSLCNLEIGTQFLDSENAQRNLEIAQIPRLRGTYTYN